MKACDDTRHITKPDKVHLSQENYMFISLFNRGYMQNGKRDRSLGICKGHFSILEETVVTFASKKPSKQYMLQNKLEYELTGNIKIATLDTFYK